VVLWWTLAIPSCVPNLKSLESADAEILKGKPQILGSSQGRTLFFNWSDSIMGLGKPQLQAKLEVAGFIYYGNIREFVFKRQIPFLSYPLGELG